MAAAKVMVEYIVLKSSETLPNIAKFKPFKAVIIVESLVSSERQNEISDWLVHGGCYYVMAWGNECSSWDDTVDLASIQAETPDDEHVMTTWHDEETLEDVFFFAKNCALHEKYDLEQTLIIHLAGIEKKDEFLRLYQNT